MHPKLLKSSQRHEFVAAEYHGKNEAGYQPIGDNVLLAPDTAAEKTSGGVDLTPEYVARITLAAETGVVVALGSDAFLWNSDRSRKWEGVKPKAGDRVYVERYSGQLMLGKDHKIYRVMTDKCISAVEIADGWEDGATVEQMEAAVGLQAARDALDAAIARAAIKEISDV